MKEEMFELNVINGKNGKNIQLCKTEYLKYLNHWLKQSVKLENYEECAKIKKQIEKINGNKK